MDTGRRRLLLTLGTLALFGGGCSLLPQSELESAIDEFDEVLASLPTGDQPDALLRIAREIKDQSRQLLATHREFLHSFNRLAVDRDADSQQLERLASQYQQDRLAQRHSLLTLQDELHALIPADQWPALRDVLHYKGRALSQRHLGAD